MPNDTVNPQITDAVTQANVKVMAEAPTMAMGSIYQTMAHSMGILFENAVAAQQQGNIAAQAATNQGVIQIYSQGLAAGQTGVADNLTSLLTVLNGFREGAPAAAAEAPKSRARRAAKND